MKEKELDLQEFFALPVAPRVVAILDNMPLYGSHTLNFSFLYSMSKVDKLKPVIDQIKRLVSEKIIIPCWLNRGVLKIRKFIINEKGGIKSILGFYVSDSKQVYILLDNQISKWGFAPNNAMADLLVHECVHMYADRFQNKFFEVFQEDLVNFYYNYFNKVFSLGDKSVKEINDIVRFLFYTVEKKVANGFTNSLLKRYNDVLVENLKKYSDLKLPEFNERVSRYILVMKLYSKGLDTFLTSASKFTDVLGPMKGVYKEVFGGIPDTIHIQELFLCSEVMAIASEIKMKKKFYNIFMI